MFFHFTKVKKNQPFFCGFFHFHDLCTKHPFGLVSIILRYFSLFFCG